MASPAHYLRVDPDAPFAHLEGGPRYLRTDRPRGGVPCIRETQGYVSAIRGRLFNHSRSDK